MASISFLASIFVVHWLYIIIRVRPLNEDIVKSLAVLTVLLYVTGQLQEFMISLSVFSLLVLSKGLFWILQKYWLWLDWMIFGEVPDGQALVVVSQRGFRITFYIHAAIILNAMAMMLSDGLVVIEQRGAQGK